VKSKKFKDYTYVGDPINAVRIFNEKEVDELVILDIEASKKKQAPQYETIAEITGEAFMPLAYGGGITALHQAEQLFYNGVEKIVLNTILHKKEGKQLVADVAAKYGAQSVIASIDVKYNMWGKAQVYAHTGEKVDEKDAIVFAKQIENSGAGELFLNVVNRDGMYSGYDLELLQKIAQSVKIPVVICGGAASKQDFAAAEENGASAMAAGSMFVFQRPNQAVLISYPKPEEIRKFNENL
jgi:cyclase